MATESLQGESLSHKRFSDKFWKFGQDILCTPKKLPAAMYTYVFCRKRKAFCKRQFALLCHRVATNWYFLVGLFSGVGKIIVAWCGTQQLNKFLTFQGVNW